MITRKLGLGNEPLYPDYNSFPEEEWGTIAFEDLWPALGDYDFYDLVVDFKLAAVTNAKNQIVEFRAIGASFHNAFAIQLRKVPAASVLKVTNTFENAYSYNYFKLHDNGVEAEQEEAVIIAYDDAYKVLPHPGDGNTGVNTTLKGIYVEPIVVDLVIYMMEESNPAKGYEPLNLEEYAVEYVNMFMVIRADQGRGREVHLPGYPPTQLVDKSLFGTLNDDTNPDKGKLYLSQNNCPWALLLVTRS